MIKKWLNVLLLLGISSSALAGSHIVTLSRFGIGKDKWAFNREEVMLNCEQDGAIFVINPSTLMQYPLNDKADILMKTRRVKATPISVIQLADPAHPGRKMSLQPFIERALKLCQE